jgi:prevent-host-death family protein
VRGPSATASYGAVQVPASDLKNDWHHWLDQVARARRTIVVTRYGTPIATLAPIEDPHDRPFFGALRGWVTEQADLIAPVDEDWDVEG